MSQQSLIDEFADYLINARRDVSRAPTLSVTEKRKALLKPLAAALERRLSDNTPDGRNALYAIDGELWDVAGGEARGELVARIEPQTIAGLRATLERISDLIAGAYPGATIEGAEPHALARRDKSTRAALSTHGGSITFRARYSVDDSPHLATVRLGRVAQDSVNDDSL